MVRRSVLLGAIVAAMLASGSARAQQPDPRSLDARIQAIMDRPEFKHAFFGIEFYDLDQKAPIFALNGDKLFTPASTTKLLTEGTALQLLGADFRFRTMAYRTGTVRADGTLEGDLVLVASGDPNLSGRIQADGTLAFENEDHAYDGAPETKAVPGDPLFVIREIAAQVAAKGIKRVNGRVLVDASLFPEGERELGTGVVISPIVVNDNLVDVTITAGSAAGGATTVSVSPITPYVRFVNRATTGAPDSHQQIRWASDVTAPDGSHTVTIEGSMPAGKPGVLFAYAVPSPSRYAAVALVQALGEKGVKARTAAPGEKIDFKKFASRYTPANVVAQHESPPLREETKVTLKVSQNLHASMTPYILAAYLAHTDSAQNGFDKEREFLTKAGLDLSSAVQGDGAGGSAHFTPDFMVHYLAYMALQPSYQDFFNALPVLGRDGTLFNVQTESPAAGQVHAKTGTFTDYDALNRRALLTAKGLAGYLTTIDGRHLAFAAYVNNVPLPDMPDAVLKIAGQALGEIAAAAYDSKPLVK